MVGKPSSVNNASAQNCNFLLLSKYTLIMVFRLARFFSGGTQAAKENLGGSRCLFLENNSLQLGETFIITVMMYQ